jgi:hypothetical protein
VFFSTKNKKRAPKSTFLDSAAANLANTLLKTIINIIQLVTEAKSD